MRRALSLSAVVFAMFAAREPVLAHHSFATQFDPTKPINLKGIVTKVEWRNPHIWVYLDVTEEDGSVTAWECEGGAPNALTRRGWTRETLKLGSSLEVKGYLARSGTNTCNARTWISEGRTVFAGEASDGGPQPD
jgi:Family of unknown function (DUF6152)